MRLIIKVLAITSIFALGIVFFESCSSGKQLNGDKSTHADNVFTESSEKYEVTEPKQNVLDSSKAVEVIEDAPNEQLRYTNNKYKFSVTFPKSYGYEFEKTWEGSAEREASPDGGINIYIEGKKEEKIYVFGQNGHIAVFDEGVKREEFVTNSNVKGELSSVGVDGNLEMHLVLSNQFNGANVHVSIECYKKNKDQIFEILKSIELID